MIQILTIIGARPQFVKAAVVSKALAEAEIRETIIHTGQHYDHNMSTVFWEELGIPAPHVNLEVGSGSHGEQTGEMLKQIEQHIFSLDQKPNGVLVYGDTNSTLAGALTASKLHIPVIHVEAGLRSFNRKMPEEINRVLTDHVSSLLFCSSEIGLHQLAEEGISEGVFDYGDVMYDAVQQFSEIAKSKIELDKILPFKDDKYYLATIHRPSNTNSKENLNSILNSFSTLEYPVLWPVHPRNKKALDSLEMPPNLFIAEPLSYFEMLVALKHSFKVLTDSGGLQKEAYWMKKQCITIREETEWVETLEGNWNQLTGPDTKKIIEACAITPSTKWKPLYGDGNASQKIAAEIGRYLS